VISPSRATTTSSSIRQKFSADTRVPILQTITRADIRAFSPRRKFHKCMWRGRSSAYAPQSAIARYILYPGMRRKSFHFICGIALSCIIPSAECALQTKQVFLAGWSRSACDVRGKERERFI